MADRALIIAELAASFPAAKITRETQIAYVRQLADIPVDELAEVAKAYTLEAQWFPTIRDLRRGVVERRLGLPGPEDAWARALQWATTPATIRCTVPDCNQGVVPGGEPVELDLEPLEQIKGDYFRGILTRVAKMAAQPTRICDECDGSGRIPNPDRGDLPSPVRRALEHVGGAPAIAETDQLGILRAQFLKAYDRTREEALRTENLTSAGLALEARAQPAITGGTDG